LIYSSTEAGDDPPAVGFRSFRLVFNVPGDPVAQVTAAYRKSLDALAGGRSPDPKGVRALMGREYTRGHFARAE